MHLTTFLIKIDLTTEVSIKFFQIEELEILNHRRNFKIVRTLRLQTKAL